MNSYFFYNEQLFFNNEQLFFYNEQLFLYNEQLFFASIFFRFIREPTVFFFNPRQGEKKTKTLEA